MVQSLNKSAPKNTTHHSTWESPMRKLTFVLTLIAAFALFLGSAYAKKKSLTVTNSSGKRLKIAYVFSARGCSGSFTKVKKAGTATYFNMSGVCKTYTRILSNRSSRKSTYKYKWPASKYRVSVLCRWNIGTKLWKLLAHNQRPSYSHTISSFDTDCKTY